MATSENCQFRDTLKYLNTWVCTCPWFMCVKGWMKVICASILTLTNNMNIRYTKQTNKNTSKYSKFNLPHTSPRKLHL